MSFRWVSAVLALTPAVATADQRCTQQQAIAAEEESSSLHTWSALFRSFSRYRQCDDGAIAEGYGESVSLLLADRWSDLGEALQLFKAHPSFEKFVLSHVDLTVPVSDTARWVAVYRAMETERPDALFRDRLDALVASGLVQTESAID